MFEARDVFADRQDAGRRLATAVAKYADANPLVLALPRGGVPVGFEVASALGATLDILIVRKIGAPGHAEYGIGAVVDGANPQVVLNEEAMRIVRPSPDYLEAEKNRQLAEIERRRETYMEGRPPVPVEDRTVIVVDDGIATGGTVKAALRSLRRAGARRIILAVPVAPPDTIEALAQEADEVVCLSTPEAFRAVGLHYENFEQTSDEEVVSLLHRARSIPVRPQ